MCIRVRLREWQKVLSSSLSQSCFFFCVRAKHGSMVFHVKIRFNECEASSNDLKALFSAFFPSLRNTWAQKTDRALFECLAVSIEIKDVLCIRSVSLSVYATPGEDLQTR